MTIGNNFLRYALKPEKRFLMRVHRKHGRDLSRHFWLLPNNPLMSSLLDWVESLTDMLSGIATTFQGNDYGMEIRWRNALSREVLI